MNHPENLTPTQALELLVEGNGRFVSNLRSIETVISTDKLKNITENGQSPFSVILTCSDSRIPTEIVFDRGLGDLFVIRIAGNIISPSIIGSIEFAASSFGTQLCLVMGHTHCGAVQAALGAGLDGVQFSGNIEKIVQKISPSVNAVISAKGSADRQVLEHQVAVENVRRSVELITRRRAQCANSWSRKSL